MTKNQVQTKEMEYRTVPIKNIEVWNEANVRHTEISGGIEELAESIKK